MIITKISRKVTGANYSNIELTATLAETEQEDVERLAIELDRKCLDLLQKIQDEKIKKNEKINEKYRMLDKIDTLRRAVEKETVDELPF